MKAFPDAKVLINDTKPRSKSYELSVIKEDGEGWWKEMQLPVIPSLAVAMLLIIIFLFCFVLSESLIWTGIKKGPPRKLKFPVNSDLIEEVKKIL